MKILILIISVGAVLLGSGCTQYCERDPDGPGCKGTCDQYTGEGCK